MIAHLAICLVWLPVGDANDRAAADNVQTARLKRMSAASARGRERRELLPAAVRLPVGFFDEVEDGDLRAKVEQEVGNISGTPLVLFDSTRQPKVPQQAWVFSLFGPDNIQRNFEQLLVAAFSLIHTGRTERLIVVLASTGYPRSNLERLRHLGFCQVRLVEEQSFVAVNQFYRDHPNYSIGGPEVSTAFGEWWPISLTKIELFSLVDLDVAAYLDTDVLVLRPDVDRIFAFPSPGFHFAAAPSDSAADCALHHDDGRAFSAAVRTSERGINAGLIVVAPSLELYDLALHFARMLRPSSVSGHYPLQDQMLLNVLAGASTGWASATGIRFHCVPAAWNCQRDRIVECVDHDGGNLTDQVYIRHFGGSAKPLLFNEHRASTGDNAALYLRYFKTYHTLTAVQGSWI